MPEPKIERYEAITPATITNDDYGNISVSTTTGQTVKVNKKHEGLHPLFREAVENQRAVKIGYAVYLNQEYIHTAVLFDGKVAQTEPIKTGGDKQPAPPSTVVHDKGIAPQAVGMITKEIGDQIRADILIKLFGAKIAANLIAWYRTQVLGITQISYDGDDLPKLKGKVKED